jgi:hypothetical protein
MINSPARPIFTTLAGTALTALTAPQKRRIIVLDDNDTIVTGKVLVCKVAP